MRRVTLLPLMIVLSFTAPALAQAPTQAPTRIAARLTFSRSRDAASCPEETALRAAVKEHVGYDPFVPDAGELVTTTIEREDSAFVARMAKRDAAGNITWTHPPISDGNCRKLVRKMGLAIAIAIDPYPTAGQAPPPPPVVVVLPPEKRKDEPPKPPPTERPKVRAALGSAAQFGIAPAPAPSFTAQIGIEWSLLVLSLEGRADVPMSGEVASGQRARSSLLALSLVPCVGKQWTHVGVLGCGLLTVGALRGEGVSVDAPRGGSAAYVGAGARPVLVIPLGSIVALQVFGDVLGTLRPVKGLLNGREAWTTPAFTGGVGGGVAARF